MASDAEEVLPPVAAGVALGAEAEPQQAVAAEEPGVVAEPQQVAAAEGQPDAEARQPAAGHPSVPPS